MFRSSVHTYVMYIRYKYKLAVGPRLCKLWRWYNVGRGGFPLDVIHCLDKLLSVSDTCGKIETPKSSHWTPQWENRTKLYNMTLNFIEMNNKMQLCRIVYYSIVPWLLSMFRAILSLIIRSFYTVITASSFTHVCRCRPLSIPTQP